MVVYHTPLSDPLVELYRKITRRRRNAVLHTMKPLRTMICLRQAVNDALQPGGGATSDDSPEDGDDDDSTFARRRRSHEGQGEGGYGSNSSGNDDGTGVSTLTPYHLYTLTYF